MKLYNKIKQEYDNSKYLERQYEEFFLSHRLFCTVKLIKVANSNTTYNTKFTQNMLYRNETGLTKKSFT